jgi:molecular chaperone GrpE
VTEESRDDLGTSPSTAGPVPDDGGALRAGHGPSSTPPSSAPPAEDADLVESDIDALLADTQRERDEYLDLAKRTKADFENYRKRMTAEAQVATQRGRAELARELVPVLDSLERALRLAGIDSVASAATSDDVGSREQGLLLIFRDLHQVLSRAGIERFDPKGEEFDPNLHEALSTAPTEGVESGVVVEVIQTGYRLGDQLIRPARVVVSE